jgi:acetoin utilization transport system permease protein
MRLSWDQVKRRKVVTGLCAAGISIGCAAIIVALSVGESAQKYSEQELNRFFKMDEISVTANSGVSGGSGGELLERGKLTDQKLKLIRQFPHVSAAAPHMRLNYFQMFTADERNSSVEVMGTDLELLTSFDHKFMQGSPSDLTGTIILNYGATLGLVDEETRQNLYAQLDKNPYDSSLMTQYRNMNKVPSALYQKQIQFRMGTSDGKVKISSPLRVVGILKKPEGVSEESASYDKKAYVSLETARMLKQELSDSDGTSSLSESFDTVVVQVDSQDNIKQVEEMIQKLTLKTQNNLGQKERLAKEFGMIKAIALGIGVFILIIASISIIVAMTMSTYQRRRQIGIMKVLGANLRQIRNMFIVEAALLGLLGGLLGMMFSYWIVWGINALVQSMSQQQESIIFIPPATVLIGIAFAVMTGVLSGIYPAISASRTDALTAIRRD